MSKRNKSDDSGDDPGFSDSDLALMRENDWTVDATGNVFDDHGNELPPGVVAGAIVVDEMDIPAAKRADGLDAIFARPVGTPPAPFVRPGTPIDSDGGIGAPAELQAQRPLPDPVDTPEGRRWQVGPGVSPPPDALAQAQAAGADLWSRLVPSGDALKADHREAARGQYVTGPSHPPGTPAGPSHEVAQVDLSSDAAASAFIRSRSAPTPASVPTVRVVPQEETKGASL